MSTDIYFNTSPTTIKTTGTEETQLDKNGNPLQNSNASSSVLMFESPTAEVPDRTTTPFRSVNINVDEPLDRSQFAVYEGNLYFLQKRAFASFSGTVVIVYLLLRAKKSMILTKNKK